MSNDIVAMNKALIDFYLENGVDLIMETKTQDRTKKEPEKMQEKTPSAVTAKSKIQESTVPTPTAIATPEMISSAPAAKHPAEDCNTLEELYNTIGNFEGCALKKTAINTVIFDGNPNAEILFIGEAPGRNEDERGIPFCGQSGKLLNQIILSLGIKREEAYITNTVFWRPPGNRRPTFEEINICRPFVQKHIALLKPKVIILVGATAVESLLGKPMSMSSVRKKIFEYSNPYLTNNIKMFAIFHPSYLLRQPLKKKDMWSDIQFILRSIKNDCDSHSSGKILNTVNA